MDITGRLIRILPVAEGQSARGAWKRGGFVIETEDTYPRQVAFTLFGEDRLAMLNGLQLQTPVSVTFSPESREYQERWYTDLRCIRVMPMTMPNVQAAAYTAPAPQAAPPAPQPNFASTPTMGDNGSDLPFEGDDLPF